MVRLGVWVVVGCLVCRVAEGDRLAELVEGELPAITRIEPLRTAALPRA